MGVANFGPLGCGRRTLGEWWFSAVRPLQRRIYNEEEDAILKAAAWYSGKQLRASECNQDRI